MRLGLLIVSILLFIGNYQICEWVYPDSNESSINSWNILNDDITHLVIMLLIILVQLCLSNDYTQGVSAKLLMFFTYISIGISSSDVVDRWIFDVRNCLWSDIVMILIVLVAGYRKYLIQKLK